MKHAIFWIVCATCLSWAARAQACQWTGTFSTSFGLVHLQQDGDAVFGDYPNGRGVIAGQRDGCTLNGVFLNTRSNQFGPIRWEIERIGGARFAGRWANAGSAPNGTWNGNRTSNQPPAFAPGSCAWDGKWLTSFGETQLRQSGRKVSGDVRGSRLEATWSAGCTLIGVVDFASGAQGFRLSRDGRDLSGVLFPLGGGDVRDWRGARIGDADPLPDPGAGDLPVVFVDEWSARPAVARFDYSVPARYGLDQNQSGTIDLPNSRDYALNRPSPVNIDGCACLSSDPQICAREAPRFAVYLEDAGSEFGYPQRREKTAEEIRQEARAVTGLDTPIAAVNTGFGLQTGLEAHYRAAISPRPEVPNRTPMFTVTAADGQVTRGGLSDGRFRVCLPEGKHRVSYHLGPAADAPAATRHIEVVDHLIVVLGDSFAAGEGAPERIKYGPRQINWVEVDTGAKFVTGREAAWLTSNVLKAGYDIPTLWADHGLPLPPKRRVALWETSSHGQLRTVLEDGLDTDLLLAPQHANFIENLTGHRSSFTHASQYALALETYDARSSVTFINLAQTGAMIERGILGPYGGATNEALQVQVPRAQRSALESILGTPKGGGFQGVDGVRAIDSLYMSVGGNDAGFANILKASFVAWETMQNDLTQIESAFENGTWRDLKSDWVFAGTLNEENGEFIADTPGRKALPDLYRKLDAVFDRWRVDGLLSGDVAFILPPYFGSSHVQGWQDGRAVLSVGATSLIMRNGSSTQRYCAVTVPPVANDHIFAPNLWGEILPETFRWLDQKIYFPMTITMRNAAQAHGWKLIDQGQTPANHGICGAYPYASVNPIDYNAEVSHPVPYAPDALPARAWYNTNGVSENLQVGNAKTTLGSFHPNPFGYAHVAQLMKADAPHIGGDFDGAWFEDLNDQIREKDGVRGGPRVLPPNRTGRAQLAGVHDVALFLVRLPANRTARIPFAPEGSATAIGVSVFDSSASVLASSVGWSGFAPARFGSARIDAPSRTVLVTNATDQPVEVFVAVHDTRNVDFDIVSGLGDARGVKVSAPQLRGVTLGPLRLE